MINGQIYINFIHQLGPLGQFGHREQPKYQVFNLNYIFTSKVMTILTTFLSMINWALLPQKLISSQGRYFPQNFFLKKCHK